jgi:hypothetical protein
MMRDASNWIGIILLLFSLGLLPATMPPEDPNPKLHDLAESSLRSEAGDKAPATVDVERRYEGFMVEGRVAWLKHIFLLLLSIVGVVLTLLQKRLGLWVVLLLCVLMLMIYFPPLLPDLFNGRFIRTIFTLKSTVFRTHGLFAGSVFFWHIAIAPFAYLSLAVATMIALRSRSLKRLPT